MALDPLTISVISVLAVPLARKIFEQIVESRTVRFAELRRTLERQDQPSDAVPAQVELNPAEISDRIDILKELKLIEEVDMKNESPEFRTFFVTPYGLSIERQLRSFKFEETDTVTG